MFTRGKPMVCLFLSLFIMAPTVLVLKAAEGADARQQRLIEGAKKEGELVIWHISILSEEKVLRPFKEKYPFLKVKTWQHRGAEGATKAIEEAQAGLSSHDVSIIADQNMGRLLKAGLLAEYDWPNTKGWLHQPKHNFFRGIIAAAKVPTFNSKIIPKAEWPRTWDDIKDPKWRGRAIASTAGADTALYTAYLWRKSDGTLNWDRSFKYWSEVIKATKPRVSRGYTAPTEMLATGIVSIFIWNAANTAQRAMWKGAPVRLLPVKKLIAGNHSLGIMKRSPHPNAARLFADFLTSKEGLVPFADSRAAVVNSPELAKLTRGNKHLAELGFTFEVIPQEVATYENNDKAIRFWFSELGIKKRERKRKKGGRRQR